MKHNRDQMPPDELMCKVVAKWKGVDVPFMVTTSTVGKGIVGLRLIGGDDIEVTDPRFDTDAALELLHWTMKYLDDLYSEEKALYTMTTDIIQGTGWSMYDIYANDDFHELPTSGEPFRLAVCWLAVDVLGGGR